MSEEKIKKIIRDICLGLKELHNKQIVHLDIRPENVLLSKSKRFKIADLRLARLAATIEESTKNNLNELRLFDGGQIRATFDLTKIDVYCLGIMTYGLMKGQALSVDKEKAFGNRAEGIDMDRIGDYSKELRELVGLMVQEEPTKRPSVDEILVRYLPSAEETKIQQLRQENSNLKKEIMKFKMLNQIINK